MPDFVLSREALSDLDLVWAYIAQDNLEAADRVIAAAYRTCTMLAEHPELGRLRQFPGNTPANLRSFGITDFPSYMIFYRVERDTVQVVRVVHGARAIEDFSDLPP